MAKSKDLAEEKQLQKNKEMDFAYQEENWLGRVMTRIIWGDKVADSGWIDPQYRKHGKGRI